MANDAPGLVKRRRTDGTFALYWSAAAVSRKAVDYPLRTIRLSDDETDAAARCRILTAELRAWLAEQAGFATPARFEGTVASLIECYTRDEYSPYRTIKANTRRQYDDSLAVVKAAVGARRIDVLTRADFMRWHQGFRFPEGETGPDRVRRAHHAMKLVRILVNFGASMRYPGCADAAMVLSKMTFVLPAPRRSQLTLDQATAIIDAAIAAGRPSIALAQAFQFELTLRQKDVIGEWFYEPSTGADGAIRSGGWRWANGVLWSDVSVDGVLVKQTTKTAAIGEWRLALYPLVTKALAAMPEGMRAGPMIVSETIGKPYRPDDFRVKWRRIATAAGVPADVWNMDSRAGGITEGADAGATIEDLRRHATHADGKMTARYMRGTEKATAKVATLRAASRKKPGE